MEPAESNLDLERGTGRAKGPRHSILDLAPLELECMSVLWPMGEGTVRDIHQQLTLSRPRAYTTVLTILDRLEQKGIVTRRKLGRAFWYRANLSADEARLKAVEKIVTGFFDGSADALVAHLTARTGGAEEKMPPSIHRAIDTPAPTVESSQALDDSLL